METSVPRNYPRFLIEIFINEIVSDRNFDTVLFKLYSSLRSIKKFESETEDYRRNNAPVSKFCEI